jgi:ankyrin repeat protein
LTSTSAHEPQTHFQLRRAVRRGSVGEVRALLDAGVDPNVLTGTSSPSTLALAADRGSVEIVELLVAHGADPSWVSPHGWSAATYADANDFADLAEHLMEIGASRASRFAHGYSRLHRAARSGDVDALVGDLASREIEVDVCDAEGSTPLVLAIRWRRTRAVDALLRHGADPNFCTDGWSVLCEAAYQDARPDDPTRFVERLLAAGADPNPKGYPPLLAAVNQEWSSGGVLRRLVAAGADVSAVSPWDGETVLHRIAAISDADLVDVALDLGANREAHDGAGRTPLLSAAVTGNDETFLRLLERGADLDARDATGLSVSDLLDDSDEADEIRRHLALFEGRNDESGDPPVTPRAVP